MSLFSYIREFFEKRDAKKYGYPNDGKYGDILTLQQNARGKYGIYNSEIKRMLDLETPKFFWLPDQTYYFCCWGSRKNAHFAAREFLNLHYELDYLSRYGSLLRLIEIKRQLKKKNKRVIG